MSITKEPAPIEVRYSAFHKLMEAVQYLLVLTALAFFVSNPFGWAVAGVSFAVGALLLPVYRRNLAARSAVLVIDRDGLHSMRYLARYDIPWSEIEELDLSLRQGRHRRTRLRLRVCQPERYISRTGWIRALGTGFNVVVPLDDLQCEPPEVVEQARRFLRCYGGRASSEARMSDESAHPSPQPSPH